MHFIFISSHSNRIFLYSLSFLCEFTKVKHIQLPVYFRMERDADFLHKKAERATLRVCLRDKYRLPKVSNLVSHLVSHTQSISDLLDPLKNLGFQVSKLFTKIVFDNSV